MFSFSFHFSHAIVKLSPPTIDMHLGKIECWLFYCNSNIDVYFKSSKPYPANYLCLKLHLLITSTAYAQVHTKLFFRPDQIATKHSFVSIIGLL